MPSNVHIVSVEYPRGIYFPTFVVDSISKLYLRPSVLSIKDSRFTYIIDGVLLDFFLLIKFEYLSVFERHYKTTEIFHILFYEI